MLKQTLRAATLLLAGLIAGCGSGLNGTYRDAKGFLSIRFAPSHTAYIKTAAGAETTARYELQGNRIILSNAGGEVVLIRRPDGTLAGSPAGPLVKTER